MRSSEASGGVHDFTKGQVLTQLHVIGDSITYLARSHGAEAMFAEAGVDAILNGDPGDRADTPARLDAWVSATSNPAPPDVAVYALGSNDIMKETFRDPEDPGWSNLENAYLVSALTRALSFGSQLVGLVAWVNVTERTMNGNYNRGARIVNAKMREVCAANQWGYVEWNAMRAPTTDLIHQKPAGTVMWVNAINAMIKAHSS